MSTATFETTPPGEDRSVRYPRLAAGTELFGQYDGSAYHDAAYLVRRHDGQVIQLTRLLYLVASFLDGERHLADVAQQVTERFGRQVVADNVDYLVTHKLQPLGLVTPPTDDNPQPLTRSQPLLALRYRARLVPPRCHRAVTMALRPLFWPPLVLATVASLIGFNAWAAVNATSAATAGFRQTVNHPGLFLLVTGLIIASSVFHETGHATAARYGGASPAAMGVGIYLVWPVFYTDLTDSYRLNRRGRLRTDLGGVYFNAIFILGTAAIYLATGFAPLLIFIALSETQIAYQFLPFIRLDGYYVLSVARRAGW